MAEQLKGNKGWVTKLTAQLTELCTDDLECLLECLHSEINRRERSQAFSESKLAPQVNVESRRPPAAATALISNESRGKYCLLCPGQIHEMEDCRDLRNASVSEGWEMIRKVKLRTSRISAFLHYKSGKSE